MGYHNERFPVQLCEALILLSQRPTLCFILLIADLQLFFFLSKAEGESREKQTGQADHRPPYSTSMSGCCCFFFSSIVAGEMFTRAVIRI